MERTRTTATVAFLLVAAPALSGEHVFFCGPQSLYIERGNEAEAPIEASASAVIWFDTDTQESELTIASRTNSIIGQHTWNFNGLEIRNERGTDLILGFLKDVDYEQDEPYWELYPDKDLIFVSYDAAVLQALGCLEMGGSEEEKGTGNNNATPRTGGNNDERAGKE